MIFLLTLLLLSQTPTKLSIVKTDRLTDQRLITLFNQRPQRILLYISEDSTYFVEGQFRSHKEQIQLSNTEYKELMQKPIKEFVVLENFRTSYITSQTALGIGLYSWAVPTFFDARDESGLAIGFLTPMLTFAGSVLVSDKKIINSGTAYGAFMGGLIGAAHGGLIFSKDNVIFPVSVVENLTDFLIMSKLQYPSSVYQRKVNHFFLSYYHYAMASLLVNGRASDLTKNGSILSVFEGYAALFATGLTSHDNLTLGDAMFEFRTAIIGAECIPALIATVDLFRGDEASNPRIYATTSLLGHIAGYYVGYKLSQKYDLSTSEGILTWLFPYLVHGTTAGLALLLDSGDMSSDIWKLYPVIFLGTEITLTYVTYKNYTKIPTKTSLNFDRFNVCFNPIGLFVKQIKSNLPLAQITIKI